MSPTLPVLRLSRTQLSRIIAHARAEAPLEACGLLEGRDGVVSAVHCLANARRSPTAFELTADGYLLAADLDEAGCLLGVFHSHPGSDAVPSPTDIAQAHWPIVSVIVSLAHDRPVVRAFRLQRRWSSAEAADDYIQPQAVVKELALEVLDNGPLDA